MTKVTILEAIIFIYNLENDCMKYPNKLKHWRELRRYSQPDLAKALVKAGFSTANKQLIWKIENGERKMTPQEAHALATFLECNIDDFFEAPVYNTPKQNLGGMSDPPYRPQGSVLRDFIDLWERANPTERKQILGIAVVSDDKASQLDQSVLDSLKPAGRRK